jgi:hypothetical protein
MVDLTKDKRPEYVEEIPDKLIDANASLTDDQLKSGGMTPVAVWVRTRSSANALRKQRARDKAEAGSKEKAPYKQLNISAPVEKEARDALKNVAKLMLDGDLSPSDLDVMGRLDTMRHGIKVGHIYSTGGWRAVLLRKILG